MTRRQEKVARVIKEVVSDAIANHLGDPRIVGFVSVTQVDMAPDLRNAEVYLSIFGKDPADQNKTFEAIKHARTKIQSLVAREVQSKFCPVLHFHLDDKFKKTLETMRLIEEAASQFKDKESDSELNDEDLLDQEQD